MEAAEVPVHSEVAAEAAHIEGTVRIAGLTLEQVHTAAGAVVDHFAGVRYTVGASTGTGVGCEGSESVGQRVGLFVS